METLQKNQTTPGINTPSPFSALTDKEIQIGKILHNVSDLLPYPMKDDQIARWAQAINEDRPNLKLERLKSIIKHARQGKFVWNTKVGIQNIYMALQYLNDNADYSHVPESFYRF